MLERFLAGFLNFLAPTLCIDCARPIAAASAARRIGNDRVCICVQCASRLAWWRILDGCPHCGWDHRDRISGTGSSAEAGSGVCPGCYSQGSALDACQTLLRYEGRATDWIPRFKRIGSAQLTVSFFLLSC